MHLNAMIASRKNSFCLTGNQRRCLNVGVMRGNFLVPVIMHAAKFCTDCSLQMFLFEVFDHTVEQYSNLLKTKAFITVTSWLRSRTCLTRLICARLDMQDEVVFKTWSSNLVVGL